MTLSNNDKINVLFVCLGNICRSPMAEAVFKHVAKEQGVYDKFEKIDSAGTAGYHVGDEPDSRTQDVCRKHKVPINHSVRQVTAKDFSKFHYVLCMDQSNLRDLERKKPCDSTAEVRLFGDFNDQGKRIIEDPYYGGAEDFEYNFQQVTQSSLGLLRHLKLIE